MKIDFRNPNIYYILIPALAALWVIMAGFVFYPKSVRDWEESRTEYNNAQGFIDELVDLQPERLAYKVDKNDKPEEFDFNKTVGEFAQIFTIPSSNYHAPVKGEANRAGRKTQSATISIKDIEIEKMAQFLSALLLRWPDLKCERLSIDKIKNTKNNWNVEMALTYYY